MAVCRVVLFANGIGSDASAYRPAADTSQWWNRRDALVRCVAAFLFGPRAATAAAATATSCCSSGRGDTSDATTAATELVIVYDQDWACLHMRYDNTKQQRQQQFNSCDALLTKRVVPTEQHIISLWKRAAKAPGATVQDGSGLLSCQLILPLISTTSALSLPLGTVFGRSSSASTHPQNKREILEYLQQTCSMDFLRQHRLNSSIDTLARKSNRKKLMDAKREWDVRVQQQQRQQPSVAKKRRVGSGAGGGGGGGANDEDTKTGRCLILEQVLKRLLQPQSANVKQVVAVTLHESSDDELPCWDHDSEGEGGSDGDLQLCLFLGAVRDMLPSEVSALHRVCSSGDDSDSRSSCVTPVVPIRLGPVAEFTSKILSVVAFHHAHGRLGPSVRNMMLQSWSRSGRQPVSSRIDSSGSKKSKSNAQHPPCCCRLHFVCLVPSPSSALSADLQDRNHVLWSIVRCTVASLWRSRLAGGGGNSNSQSVGLSNRLTFLFQDGVVLTLRQEELVAHMAEQHQAAPTEYQILGVLRGKLDALSPCMQQQQPSDVEDWKSHSRSALKQLLASDAKRPVCILDFDFGNHDADVSQKQIHRFYNSSKGSASGDTTFANQSAMVVLSIASADAKSSVLMQQRKQSFLRAARKKKLPLLPGRSIVNTGPCIDQEAATISLVQHLAYQGRLFRQLTTSTNKTFL